MWSNCPRLGRGHLILNGEGDQALFHRLFNKITSKHQPIHSTGFHEGGKISTPANQRYREIIHFKYVLADFNIQFSDLIESSRSSTDNKQKLQQISKIIADNTQLMRILVSTGRLPVKELLEKVNVSPKLFERNRNYFIAMAIIYQGPYPFLRDYLDYSLLGNGQFPSCIIKWYSQEVYNQRQQYYSGKSNSSVSFLKVLFRLDSNF